MRRSSHLAARLTISICTRRMKGDEVPRLSGGHFCGSDKELPSRTHKEGKRQTNFPFAENSHGVVLPFAENYPRSRETRIMLLVP